MADYPAKKPGLPPHLAGEINPDDHFAFFGGTEHVITHRPQPPLCYWLRERNDWFYVYNLLTKEWGRRWSRRRPAARTAKRKQEAFELGWLVALNTVAPLAPVREEEADG